MSENDFPIFRFRKDRDLKLGLLPKGVVQKIAETRSLEARRGLLNSYCERNGIELIEHPLV